MVRVWVWVWVWVRVRASGRLEGELAEGSLGNDTEAKPQRQRHRTQKVRSGPCTGESTQKQASPHGHVHVHVHVFACPHVPTCIHTPTPACRYQLLGEMNGSADGGGERRHISGFRIHRLLARYRHIAKFLLACANTKGG